LAAYASYTTGESVKEVHEVFAFFLLFLIVGHVAGVVFESLHSKDPLVPAMITGQKPSRSGDVTAPAKTARRWAMLVVSSAGMALAVVGLTSMAAKVPANMPVTQIDPLVADECTACHMLYHPSLMPAESWETMMATLDDHFGEDASLDDASTAEIREWLKAHSAETAETKPAYEMAGGLTGGAFSLTETRFWKETHHDIPEAMFKSPKVYSKSNCAACHNDAETGMFSPFQIKTPD